MTQSNDFIAFATAAGANVETPAQWAADSVVQQGFQSGIASSQKINTPIRQATSIAAAIAGFMAQFGTSAVQDNGNITQLTSQFVTAISLLVSNNLPTQLLYNGTDTGTANAALLANPSPVISTVVQFDAFLIIKANTANTGPMTLQVANTTANLVWEDGSALAPGDWPASKLAFVVFDGTVFRLMSVMGPSIFARVGQIPAQSSLVHSGTDSSGTGNTVTAAAVTPSVSSVTPGMQFEITKGTAANTSAVTATIAGQTGSVVWADGTSLAALSGVPDWPALTPAILEWDGTVFRVMSVMGPSVFARASQVQPILTAAKNFFVGGTGASDSNNGLTSGAPFATLQHANNVIAGFNLNGFTVTINVASGTYAPVTLSPINGSGSINWVGNSATPSDCLIAGTAGSAVINPGTSGHTFNGFMFTSAAPNIAAGDPGCGVLAFLTGSLNLQNVQFGACQGAWVRAENGALVTFAGNIIISGGTTGNSLAVGAGFDAFNGSTFTTPSTFPALLVTVPVTVAFFIQAQLVSSTSLLFSSGSGESNVTGTRFNAIQNGVINSNSGGPTAYPGTVAGTTATGGQYV